MTRWHRYFVQLSRKLWVRATFLGFVGLVAALASAFLEKYLPWDFPLAIDTSAVESLLTIIASSMLAVTTFSLSTMLSALSSATNSVTPRATTLLMEDRLAQNVLSAFVGSFIFSIVGLVVLKTGAYGERGRYILFLVTIAMIVVIVVMLLRWINHLLLLGWMSETIDRVEDAAALALQERIDRPSLGGVALPAEEYEPPAGAVVIRSIITGYVQHIDLPALQALAEGAGGDIRIPLNPGRFVFPGSVLAWYLPNETNVEADEIREAYTIGAGRSFDEDPRFCLVVLAEVGSGALAPSRGDGGTAIDIIGRLARLMALWGMGRAEAAAKPLPEPLYPCVKVQHLRDADLFEDAFMVMGRDGAAMLEVQIRLKKVLAALSGLGTPEFRAAAQQQAALAEARAAVALSLPQDRERLAGCLND